MLRLFILNLFYSGARTKWADTEHSKLEDRLVEVFEGLVEAAATFRKRRLDAREQERRWAEEAKIRFEREELQRRELALLNELLGEAEKWQKAESIRAYIEAVGKAAIQKDGIVGPSSELGKWLEWAIERANRLDPVLTRLASSKNSGDP